MKLNTKCHVIHILTTPNYRRYELIVVYTLYFIKVMTNDFNNNKITINLFIRLHNKIIIETTTVVLICILLHYYLIHWLYLSILFATKKIISLYC